MPAARALFLLCVGSGATLPRGAADVTRIDPDPGTGSCRAVVVRHAALAHTSVQMPADPARQPAGAREPAAQVAEVLRRLGAALAAANSDLGRAVKLDVYVAAPEVVGEVQRALAGRFRGREKPAVAFAVGALPEGIAVAMDAVAPAPPGRGSSGAVARFRAPALGGPPHAGHVAVLPPGGAVYVSGQGGHDRTGVRAATLQTMESLAATLKHFGLGWPHVVQLRAFVNLASELAVSESAMLEFLGAGIAPPLVVAPCTSPTPVEIEMIAAWPPETAGGPSGSNVRHATLPGIEPSPQYSKVVIHRSTGTLYTSGLYSRTAADPATQIRDAFAQLGDILKRGGTDFDHLVKATYYASDQPSSRVFNDVRPEFLPAQRPPAASKRLVQDVGMERRSITFDMIAALP